MDFKKKNVLIMGLGLHGGGVAVAQWFIKKGADVIITDIKSRKNLRHSIKKLAGLPVTYVLGRHREADFKWAEFVIQNPGVQRESKYLEIARANGAEVYNEAGLFFELIEPKNIIGITGTRGKSTTTALTYELLKKKFPKAQFGGNIRTKAMFDIIGPANKNYSVLELSSWHLEGLERVKKSPYIAIFLNIMPDHLNRYKDINEYADAKKNIFRYQGQDDYSIFNRDNKFTFKIAKTTPSKRYWISLSEFPGENGSFIQNNWIIFRENGKEKKVINIKELVLPGEHNLYNVLAAVTAAMILGVNMSDIREVLKKFKGLNDRLEFIDEERGVKYYNDTTGTTPDAAIAALKTLGKNKNIVLIAGGSDKNLEFKKLAKEIKKYCKKVVLLKGEATEKIKKELKAIGYKSFSLEFDSMDDALRESCRSSEAGDIVLLSPAAASFGIFANEFERGERFKEAVKKLGR